LDINVAQHVQGTSGIEGFTTQTPTPPNRRRQPHPKILTIFQSPQKSLKTLYIMKNTRIITNIALFLQSCVVKVFKFQVERLSGAHRYPFVRQPKPTLAAA
jgi:hypothetical protein